MRQKTCKMTETLACGYSSESTQREHSNEYQHDRVYMAYKDLCILVPLTKIASALRGLMYYFSAAAIFTGRVMFSSSLSKWSAWLQKSERRHAYCLPWLAGCQAAWLQHAWSHLTPLLLHMLLLLLLLCITNTEIGRHWLTWPPLLSLLDYQHCIHIHVYAMIPTRDVIF